MPSTNHRTHLNSITFTGELPSSNNEISPGSKKSRTTLLPNALQKPSESFQSTSSRSHPNHRRLNKPVGLVTTLLERNKACRRRKARKAFTPRNRSRRPPLEETARSRKQKPVIHRRRCDTGEVKP
ncbi:Uncharacterized protein Rs2_02423 [Raphanus sativus]|nr:Uncharacterized protein Rs2_02423 [Raphanus sativus]